MLSSQYSQVSVQTFSSLNRDGLDQARAQLVEWLG
jgi:hypothetical protein